MSTAGPTSTRIPKCRSLWSARTGFHFDVELTPNNVESHILFRRKFTVTQSNPEICSCVRKVCFCVIRDDDVQANITMQQKKFFAWNYDENEETAFTYETSLVPQSLEKVGEKVRVLPIRLDVICVDCYAWFDLGVPSSLEAISMLATDCLVQHWSAD